MSANVPEILKLVVQTLKDKKVEDLTLLDVRKLVSYTDYFIIGTGNSSTHVQTMSDAVADLVKLPGERNTKPEVDQGSNWILYDGNFFVLNLFQKDSRKRYALEDLWQDAEQVNID
ncbi:MAG: ribosome silencing factor [Candidatus Riflebacteria bacterium]|nr:ribosome silencing factor [Candidatus Riflebacteria bacterium]